MAVSEELLEEIRARYSTPAPTLAFPNYALRRDLPSELPPAERRNGHLPRLVYQRTLSTNGGHYDLREIFRALVGKKAFRSTSTRHVLCRRTQSSRPN